MTLFHYHFDSFHKESMMNQFPSSTERLISFFILDFYLELVFNMNTSLYFIKRTTLLSFPFINYIAESSLQSQTYAWNEFRPSECGGSLYRSGSLDFISQTSVLFMEYSCGRSSSYITNFWSKDLRIALFCRTVRLTPRETT